MNGKEIGKERYLSIEIPEELEMVVNQAIASHPKEAVSSPQPTQPNIRTFHLRRFCGMTAAAIVLCFTLALNTSSAFAAAMADVPVLGPLAELLTIREYHSETEDFIMDLEIPEINLDNSQAKETNAQIVAITDAFIEEAKREFLDYKTAFFAEGGTEAEWANRDMHLMVDYKLHHTSDTLLSLELITSKNWVNAEVQHTFYNLDLERDHALTLEDLMGPDYAVRCNQSILQQMHQRMQADSRVNYFIGDPDGFTTVTPETDFYVNQRGNIVVVFPQCKVGPSSMGMQEFEIVESPRN